MNYLFFFSGPELLTSSGLYLNYWQIQGSQKNQSASGGRAVKTRFHLTTFFSAYCFYLHPFSHSLLFLLADPVALRLQGEQKYKLIRVLILPLYSGIQRQDSSSRK